MAAGFAADDGKDYPLAVKSWEPEFLFQFGSLNLAVCHASQLASIMEHDEEVLSADLVGEGSKPTCEASFGTGFIYMSDCKLNFDANGAYSFGPPGCGPVEVKWPENLCTVKLSSLSGSAPASYSDDGSHVSITLKSGFQTNARSGTYCSGTNNIEAGFSGTLKLKAYEFAPFGEGIEILSEKGIHFDPYFESGTHFNAGEYPATYSGEQNVEKEIVFGPTQSFPGPRMHKHPRG